MVGGANAQDPQGWKRPWGLWGAGFRLKEQKGPRLAPHPWSQRAGDLTWEPRRLPGLEWAGQTPSSPLLPLPLASPDLPSLRPMPSRTHAAWRGSWRAGDRPGNSAGSPCPSVWGNHLLLLSPSSRRAPPTCLSYSPLGLLPMLPRTHVMWRGLSRAGDQPGSSAGSPGQVGRAIALHSSPAPPGWFLPLASPDLPNLPPMPPGPM